MGEYLVEQTSVKMSQESSPVQGGGWKKALSPLYKKKKLDEVGNAKANLENTGEMLDELKFENAKEGIRIGVFGERAPAADGHNNLSGKSSLPERRFLPAEGQSYKAEIEREVSRIVSDAIVETTSTKVLKEKISSIENKKGLFEVLAEIFGFTSKAELRLAVFRNEEILSMLEDEDLLRFLK